MIDCMCRAAILLIVAAAGCVAPMDSKSSSSTPASTTPSDPPSLLVPALSDAAAPRITPPSGREIARSREGRPIVIREYLGVARLGVPPTVVLLFAGIHGNEPTGVYAAAQLLKSLDHDPKLVPPGVRLLVVPLANPDGYHARRRQNAAGVDLNRNFPADNFQPSSKHDEYWPGPSPLSEPESRAIHDLVVKEKPARILSLHSIRPPRHGVNYDGPARALAERIASKNHYNVLSTMGYPTPGSFGSWAGIDRKIPTITLEFPSTTPGVKAWAENREALLAFIRGE